MTKNKVFLGMTAFVLAIAGAISTRAMNRYTFYTGFTLFITLCHKHATAVACTTTVQTNACKTANGVRTVFTSITCEHKLFKHVQ